MTKINISTTFEFNSNNRKKSEEIISKYPEGRQKSAVLPLLDLAQRQNDGWISRDIVEYIANMLSVPAIRVYEVASFYTMINLEPVGKNFIQVCGTTPCWLRGSDKIIDKCKKLLKIDIGETTDDNLFSLQEVECLGACINAPMVQINDDYFENLTPESIEQIIQDLKSGKKLKISNISRNHACNKK